jgi:TerB N-terminal domain
MLGLLLFFLPLPVGTFLAYRFSSVWKVKGRVQDALSPFEELDAELHRLRRSLQNDIEMLSNRYIQGVHLERLKAIPLDELKKHATGMRLQALKDVSVWSVADLQGWNEYRVSQVRGVGPKSASAIVQAVSKITAATKAVPIDHPAPPFSREIECQLMEALYRQHWFDTHIAEQGNRFAKNLALHQSTRDEVTTKTSFSHWLWKFGSNETIRQNINRANALIGTLEEDGSRSMRDKLSTSLSDCRDVCTNRLPVESIIQDFNESREFYGSSLTSWLGQAGSKVTAKSISQQTPPNASAASDLVHVEFGHVVPGTSPPPIGESQASTASPKTQVQHSEELISVSIGPNFGPLSPEFALPIAQRTARSKDLRWLKRSESIQIHGHTLPHGFVYVGKGINSEEHYALNPWLSARPAAATPSDLAAYHFSYATLNQEQRSRYLDWLAEGASSSTVSGFGMLYFYGLERRVLDLTQGKVSNAPVHELEQLLEEVHRLGDLFKEKPGSVTQCCLRLSDFAAAHAFDGTSVPELPKSWVRTYELPFVMRYGIGCLMRDGKPVPVEWALRWAYVEPSIYLRTPATRCPQEFEEAFAVVYRERFGGDGLIVPTSKTKLKLVYQPGWPMHLEPEIKYEFSGIPDVAALSGPQQTLKAMVEQSTEMIDGYSRYLGRNTTKVGTLEALINLPLRFWPSAERDRWQAFLTSIVDPMEPVTFESLLRELGYVGDLALAKVKEIVTNLNSVLVGFEPDILTGARRPKPSEMVVLFRLTSESDSDRTTNEYKKCIADRFPVRVHRSGRWPCQRRRSYGGRSNDRILATPPRRAAHPITRPIPAAGSSRAFSGES